MGLGVISNKDLLISRYVKLISSDGHEFIVKRDNALTSGTIKVSRDYLISGNVMVFTG